MRGFTHDKLHFSSKKKTFSSQDKFTNRLGRREMTLGLLQNLIQKYVKLSLFHLFVDKSRLLKHQRSKANLENFLSNLYLVKEQ